MPYRIMSKEDTKIVADAIKSQVQITDYASSLGYTVVSKGKYASLKEIDSIMIDKNKNCFWRNSGKGIYSSGSVIEFAMNVNDWTFHEAFMELSSMVNVDHLLDYPHFDNGRKAPVKAKEIAKEQKPSRKLTLPEKNSHMRNVYAYLINTRYLEPEVVQNFVNRKMLYQDVRGNCCFVAYDNAGNPNYGFLRGTNTYNKFIGDVPGCDYDAGFFINNQAKNLIIAESVIDAASVMSILHAQGHDFTNYDYYALTGNLKLDGLKSKLINDSYEHVLMATDNDEAGRISINNIKNFLEEKNLNIDFSVHLPASKDWNQDLTNVRSKFRDINSIRFFSEDASLDTSNVLVNSFARVDGQTFAIMAYGGEEISLKVGGSLNQPSVQLPDGTMHLFSQVDTKRVVDFTAKHRLAELNNRKIVPKTPHQELVRDKSLQLEI